MKKNKCVFVTIIIFLVLVVAAIVSLIVSLIGVGPFDTTLMKLKKIEPVVELTKADQSSPQLKITYDLDKLISLRDFDAGILVFDSSAEDLKPGKQKLKYEELIRNEKLIYYNKEAFIKIKDRKVSYILDEEHISKEIDVYAFLVRNNTLYVSKITTTSVSIAALEKLNTLERSNKDYAWYKDEALKPLISMSPTASLKLDKETNKYCLRFGSKISKALYDQCYEVYILIHPADRGELFKAGAYVNTLDKTWLEENQIVMEKMNDNAAVVNENGDADKNGKYMQFAAVITNIDEPEKADMKLTACLYIVYDGRSIYSNSTTTSLNDLKSTILTK